MSQLSAEPRQAHLRPRILLFLGARASVDSSAAFLAERCDLAVRIVRGARCRSKMALLREWSAALQFPEYFGENWDAFEECLSDLTWLRRKHCAVFVTNYDQMLASSLSSFKTFVSILSEVSARPARAAASPDEDVEVAFILHCSKSRKQFLRNRLCEAQIDPDDVEWISELRPDVVLDSLELSPQQR
jgi:hypothetical protein